MSSGVPAIVPLPPQQTSLLSDEPLDPVALAHGAVQRGDDGHFDELTGRLNEGRRPQAP